MGMPLSKQKAQVLYLPYEQNSVSSGVADWFLDLMPLLYRSIAENNREVFN